MIMKALCVHDPDHLPTVHQLWPRPIHQLTTDRGVPPGQDLAARRDKVLGIWGARSMGSMQIEGVERNVFLIN
jgi:hypothetical protein